MPEAERNKVRATWRRALERAGEWHRDEEKQA
jgi:hypothetical protein